MNTGGVVGGNRSQDESPVVWLVGGLVQCLGRGKSVACYLRHTSCLVTQASTIVNYYYTRN
jgi:hypothetical protein